MDDYNTELEGTLDQFLREQSYRQIDTVWDTYTHVDDPAVRMAAHDLLLQLILRTDD